MARPFKPEAFVLGLSLVALGVAWILGNSGRIDLLGTLRAWWPLTLVLWGALELVAVALDHRTRRS
jgi:hypothetical protein